MGALPALGELLDRQRAVPVQIDQGADEAGPHSPDAGLRVEAGDVAVHVGEHPEEAAVMTAVEQVGFGHPGNITALT
jgi:hypothetical protein